MEFIKNTGVGCCSSYSRGSSWPKDWTHISWSSSTQQVISLSLHHFIPNNNQEVPHQNTLIGPFGNNYIKLFCFWSPVFKPGQRKWSSPGGMFPMEIWQLWAARWTSTLSAKHCTRHKVMSSHKTSQDSIEISQERILENCDRQLCR